MPQTILQIWDNVIGVQSGMGTKRATFKTITVTRTFGTGFTYSSSRDIFAGYVWDKPEIKNEKFINTKQISNCQDFTSRSIAPNRDNPAVQLDNTWAPEGKTYFGDAGA